MGGMQVREHAHVDDGSIVSGLHKSLSEEDIFSWGREIVMRLLVDWGLCVCVFCFFVFLHVAEQEQAWLLKSVWWKGGNGPARDKRQQFVEASGDPIVLVIIQSYLVGYVCAARLLYAIGMYVRTVEGGVDHDLREFMKWWM